MIRTNTMTEKVPDTTITLEKPIVEPEKMGKPTVEASCLEVQTYLPNLYFRKYRLIEKLNGLRYGFPTMENPETNANQPITRPLTAWDKVLQDVASKVEVMKEVKKYKIAEKAYFSRKCQRKFKRTELKRQELYCYQRCLSSKLAERVMNKFAEFTVKQEDNPIQNEPNRQIIPTNENDAFIQDEDGMGFGMPFINHPANDLLDDLFANNNIQPMQEELPVEQTIETYMKSIINQNGIGERIKIRRSEFLNSIKESMRKRLKYKEKTMSINPPKIGGAEILLNSLIKAEQTLEEDVGNVAPPAQIPFNRNMSSISLNQDQKKRKRKEDQFILNWSDDVFDEMKSMNQFVDRKATKIENLNDMLSLYVVKDPKSENYTKVFEKTIERVKEFPKTLEDVDVEEPKPSTRLVDSCFGYQNQQSLSNQQFSIEALIDHFIEVSPFLFTEDLDLSNRNYKIEIDPKYLFTVGSIRDKESILFKFDKGAVEIIDEKFFLRDSTPFGKLIKHTELFFLIEYYLSKFGNQWGLITECIRVNPIVRGMNLTSEQIQNLHSFYNMKRKKNINFSDKVILPFRDEFEEVDYPRETKSDTNYDINEDNYEAYINKQMALEEEETQNSEDNENERSYLGAKFNSFIKKSEALGVSMSSNTFLDSIKDNMSNQFSSLIDSIGIIKNKEEVPEARIDRESKMTMFEPKQKPKISKNNISLKRRKIINQRTSPLVGVLSKKKPSNTYGTYPRNDIVRRQEQTQANSTMPPPPPVPRPETQPIKQQPKQSFPTSKQKTEDKQKTPTKKAVGLEQKKAPAGTGAAGKEQNSRRRKPDSKQD